MVVDEWADFRIEAIEADGSGRAVLADRGRQPAPSPDGRALAFVRTDDTGTTLQTRGGQGEERTLVESGRFFDIGSPRYAPAGDRIAFVATGGRPEAGRAPGGWRLWADALPWFVSVAYAHGLPWDVWLVNADGSGLRRLAAVGADDASIAWSPDGTAIFVYGSVGSFLVDVTTGQVTRLPSIQGAGGVTWPSAA